MAGLRIIIVAVNLDCYSFYAKIRIWPYLVRITKLNRIILLVYKKAYFNTNDLDFAIPSVVVSLL